MARNHKAGGYVEPHAARMGELLRSRYRQQSVSGARLLRNNAVASVVAHQAQGQATQGRDLSTLAPIRALRARTPVPACARRAVGEGVMSCPRAGCGRSACPVVGAGCGNGVMVAPGRHRQTKEAATDMFDLQPPRHISTLPNSDHSRHECELTLCARRRHLIIAKNEVPGKHCRQFLSLAFWQKRAVLVQKPSETNSG